MINEWPQRAKSALAYLFRPLQDIDVYVEDSQDTVFYNELFQRIAPPTVRIARVFPAGNRLAVVAKAQAHDFAARKALFVVDGDLEWVRDDPAPNHVYRLDAYCIENLLLHEDAATQILMEEAVLGEEEARTRLDFGVWMHKVSPPLVELFMAFAALNATSPEEQTVSIGIGKVLTKASKNVSPKLDEAKVTALTAEITSKVVNAVGAEGANAILENIRARVQMLSNQMDIISGKDFLFPLFEFHLWKCTGGKVRRSSLRFRLARQCSLERFRTLSDALAA